MFPKNLAHFNFVFEFFKFFIFVFKIANIAILFKLTFVLKKNHFSFPLLVFFLRKRNVKRNRYLAKKKKKKKKFFF